MDRSAFKDLIGLITHHAIYLISRELDAAKLLAEDFNQQVSFGVEGTALIEPTGEDCMYDCDLPPRYGLPCRCWLYRCVIDIIPIPISLMHPRRFFDGPPFVVSWSMVFDPTINFAEIFRRAAHRKTTEEQDEEADEGGNAQQSQESDREEEIEKAVDNNTGDRFRRGGVDLLHAAAHQSIDFHKLIENVHRREGYAREFAKFTAIFNKKWHDKELARSLISTTFPDEIRPKDNFMYKKSGSRRRAYTGREAAEADEAKQRRAKRKDSIEEGRRRRHEDELRAGGEDKGMIDDKKPTISANRSM